MSPPGDGKDPKQIGSHAKPSAKRPWPVRVLRGLAWTLLLAVGLVALLLLALQLGLRTDFAAKKIASIASAQLKGLLAGQLKLGAVEVRGAITVCVHDAELDDPDGVPAVRARSICADADPMALLHKQIHVRSLRLESPAVFLTSEKLPDGSTTTSLQRAVALRHPSPPGPSGGPFAWTISADALTLHDGAFEVRDAPEARPKFAVHALNLDDAQARYAQSGAAAKLALQTNISLIGESSARVAIDAAVDGDITRGKLAVKQLEAHLGASGLVAEGNVDLTALSGHLRVHDLLLEPGDLDRLLGPLPLAAELKGEATVDSDGKSATAAVHVETRRGGQIQLDARSTLAQPPRWSVKLSTEHVDPSFVVQQGPPGSVTLGLTLEGTGIPTLDASGVEGDVRGQLHLGPASLQATGPLAADAEFSLQGRSALVKRLDADALAVHVKGNGVASLAALGMNLQIDADDLARVAKAIGALQKKPPPALSGSAHLSARLTGSPERPDAELHLRAPSLALGASLRVTALQVDGALHGELQKPHGTLNIGAKELKAATLALSSPAIVANVDWPKAHFQIDAEVPAVDEKPGDAKVGGAEAKKPEPGQVHIAGDAQIDEDRDGAVLSGFDIEWPGNELKQQQPTRLHLRKDETVLEPLILQGDKGSLLVAATVRPPPAPLPGAKKGAAAEPGPSRLEARVELDKFDLTGLPAFALPPSLHLAGMVTAKAGVSGTTARPAIAAQLSLSGVEVATVKGLSGDLTANLEEDRVRASGKLALESGPTLTLRADVPIEADAPGNAPLALELELGPIDLARLPGLLQRQALFLARPAGTVALKIAAQGTLDHPRAEATLSADEVKWSRFHDLGLRASLLVEGPRAHLQTSLALAKTVAATLDAETPFDLTAMLRNPKLLAHALDKPSQLKLRVPALELALLNQSGVLAQPAAGRLEVALDLDGTAASPQLQLTARGSQLTLGALHSLDAELSLRVAQQLAFSVEARPGGDARGKLSIDAQVSAPELAAAMRKGFPKELLEPLFDRRMSVDLEVEKLVLGTLSQQNGKLALSGELDGHIAGNGTLDAPQLKGNLLLRDVQAGPHELGDAEVYLEADKDGATAHLGLSPPSAQELAERAKQLALRNAAFDGGTEGIALLSASAPDAGPGDAGGGSVAKANINENVNNIENKNINENDNISENKNNTPPPLEAMNEGLDAGSQQADGGVGAPAENPLLAAQRATSHKEADQAAKQGEQAKKEKADEEAEQRKAALIEKEQHAALEAKVAQAKAKAERERQGKAAVQAPAKSALVQRGGGTFLGHATLQAQLSARALYEQGLDAIEEGDLDASMTMKNLDLTFLSGLTPLLRSTGGTLDGEVELRGILDRPEPKGELHLRDGRFDIVGQGIFDDVTLDATLTEQEIVLDKVSGSTGGGTFSGTLVLDRKVASADDEDDQYSFSGELHAGDADSVAGRKDAKGNPLAARPVPIRQAGEVRGDLSAEVDFFGDDSAGNVTATVKIPGAKIHVASLPDKKLPSLSPNPDVLVFKAGEEPHPPGIDTAELKRQKEAIAASNLRIDLQLELLKLQVSANDFEFPVTSKLHATWDAAHPDTPTADGTVEVSSGTFTALGRRFSIDSAKITETGGDIADPELEIQARYENAQASVLVLVSGTAKDPQLDLSSSPPMDQDAIAFFLATGRLQGQATTQGSGVDLGNAATSVLGAMLFGKLRSSMADIMPVDVIDIEAGGGDRPPEASVGKYIGDRIFVGYRQRFSPAPTENEQEATVEYEISRGIGASATVGEKNQGVMVTLTKDF